MRSTDFHLTSYDRAGARRTLKVLLENGELTVADYEKRQLLVTVANNVEDLDRIFIDVGGIPESSRMRRSLLKNRGRQLKGLDTICLVGFIGVLGVAQFVLEVEWTAIFLPAIFLVPMIPRAIIDLNCEEELLYYETGKKK